MKEFPPLPQEEWLPRDLPPRRVPQFSKQQGILCVLSVRKVNPLLSVEEPSNILPLEGVLPLLTKEGPPNALPVKKLPHLPEEYRLPRAHALLRIDFPLAKEECPAWVLPMRKGLPSQEQGRPPYFPLRCVPPMPQRLGSLDDVLRRADFPMSSLVRDVLPSPQQQRLPRAILLRGDLPFPQRQGLLGVVVLRAGHPLPQQQMLPRAALLRAGHSLSQQQILRGSPPPRNRPNRLQ